MTTAQLFSTDDVRSSGSKLRCESIRFVGTRSENKRRWGKEQMPVLFGRPVALLVSELDLEGATKWRKVSSALSEKGGNNFRALSWATWKGQSQISRSDDGKGIFPSLSPIRSCLWHKDTQGCRFLLLLFFFVLFAETDQKIKKGNGRDSWKQRQRWLQSPAAPAGSTGAPSLSF